MEPGIIGLLIAVSLLVGILIGVPIGKKKKITSESRGTLYVKLDAPDGQGLFLEQLVSPSVIASEKTVLFDVIVIRSNSHE